MRTTNQWTKESGASMVAIMVAMALFAIVAVMASQSFRNIGTTSRKAEAAMSAREVESVIVQAMVQRYGNFVQANCSNDPATFFSQINVGTLATATPKGVKFYSVDRNSTVFPPGETAKDDIDRCNSTPFAKFAPPNSDTFYGCYNITVAPEALKAATPDAFAANRGAFIETYVRVRNLQTDALIPCNSFVSNRGFGLEVYYSLHWAAPSGETTLYDSKTGSLNVAL